MRAFLSFISLFLSLGAIASAQVPVEGAQPQEYDFNFDGHPDYRVMVMEDGRADLYDVFIFDPATGEFQRDELLSGTINPMPHPESKEVHCIFPGGHGGYIYNKEIYGWENGKAEFRATVRQSPMTIEGKLLYVRVKAELMDGKPVIRSIELVEFEE